ncbi:TetR/AcrR family transcriptional regulator [Streptomyces acidicola]|uniref:TetR/AcrR family transcriptional regulator n=1 Tax=Streptomyces acidicola TaxID=2596892 RepID=UPI003417D786
MGDTTLRKDVARNRDLLLKADRQLFAERGLDATLNDVAHRAGAGVGTAYRRFADKDELIEAIYVQQVEELEAVLHEALACPDPWDGLVLYLERSLAVRAQDLGMAQILSGQYRRPEKHDWSRDRLAPLVNQVVDRARAAGAVRDDLTGVDLILVQVSLTALAKVAHGRADAVGRGDLAELYRRYLWVFLDGIRPDRDDATPLPVPSLTTQQVHLMLGAGSSGDQQDWIIARTRRAPCRMGSRCRAGPPAARTAAPGAPVG